MMNCSTRTLWVVLSFFLISPAIGGEKTQTQLESRPAVLSEQIEIGDRIDHIRFLGMLQLPDITLDGQRLSQLSGMAWDNDEGILYAISDKGALFHLQPIFDGEFLSGLRLLRAVPLRELKDNKPLKNWRIDSEGLEILNGRNRRRGDAELLVSFERFPRIVRYRPDGHAISEYRIPAPLNEAKNYRDANKMLESLCMDSDLGIITTPEVPLKSERKGFTRLFSLKNKSWFYPIAPGDRLTDLACLGKGEIMVLQQNYQHAFGRIVVMLKRVHLSSAKQNSELMPQDLVKFDSREGYEIDNFEALTHHQGRRFFMVSDNNDLFFQRSLLMYFELVK